MKSNHTDPSCPVITGGQNCTCHHHALHKNDTQLLYQPLQINETSPYIEQEFKDTNDKERGVESVILKSKPQNMNTCVSDL